MVICHEKPNHGYSNLLMAHDVNDIIYPQLVSLITVTCGIATVEGVFPSVSEVGIEIDHHHHTAVVVEDGVHRGRVVGVVENEPHTEAPCHPTAGHLLDFIDVKKAVKDRMVRLQFFRLPVREDLCKLNQEILPVLRAPEIIEHHESAAQHVFPKGRRLLWLEVGSVTRVKGDTFHIDI